MAETSDEKIELLVRSVLAAVDARLVEIRSEIQAVATDVERRHRDVLTHIHDLEHRWENGISEAGHSSTGADPLAARMEQATQVLLERIEAMHQRNTVATNERFALINQALEQLNVEALAPAVVAMPMASFDGMNAPLRVGPPTGQVPIAAHVPASLPQPLLPPPTTVTAQIPVTAPPIVTTATATDEPTTDDNRDYPADYNSDYSGDYSTGRNGHDSGDFGRDEVNVDESIDMDRLADLLSERLGQISLPQQLH